MTYCIIKDTPTVKAGTVGEKTSEKSNEYAFKCAPNLGDYYCHFKAHVVESTPEWFEKVGDSEKSRGCKKLAVTVESCYQVSQEEWRDKSTTKLFDRESSIADMIRWAKTLSSHYELSDLKISEVVE